MSLCAGWDARPDEYDAHRTGWLADRRLAFIGAWLPAGPLRVLELGSGTGRVLLDLARARPELDVVGVDPLEGYVAYAREQARAAGVAARYATGTGEQLDRALPDGFVADVVLSNDVLHHVEDLGAVARSVAAAARPGARWLAIEPNPRNPYVNVAHRLRAGEHVFDRRGFEQAAVAAGWHVSDRGSLFLVPPQIRTPSTPLIRLERGLERRPRLAGGLALELTLGA
jgi:SAM-dependent methyltransferase